MEILRKGTKLPHQKTRKITVFYAVIYWMILSVKSQDFIMKCRHLLQKVEILLLTVEICYHRSRFLLWTADIFMITGRDIYDGTSRLFGEYLSFSRWQVKKLLWTVEFFTLTGRDFIMYGQDFQDNRSRFYYERLRFP